MPHKCREYSSTTYYENTSNQRMQKIKNYSNPGDDSNNDLGHVKSTCSLWERGREREREMGSTT